MPLVELPTGATLHYEDSHPQSEHIPVILIHGLLGTARGHLGHVMDWLVNEGYRVIGITLRGYGESQPKPRRFPNNFYHQDANDVMALMDALSISKAHLIGYSDGGEVILIAIGEHPHRFVSAIAIGAVGYYSPELRPIFQRTYPGTWITEAEKQEHEIENTDAFALEWVRATTKMIDSGGDVSLSNAHKITCPLIIMLGKGDTLNPQSSGEKFIQQVSNGRVVMFNCGHPVHDEQTKQFRQITLKHLQDVST